MSEIFRAFENWRAHCVQEGGLSLDSATHSFFGSEGNGFDRHLYTALQSTIHREKYVV